MQVAPPDFLLKNLPFYTKKVFFKENLHGNTPQSGSRKNQQPFRQKLNGREIINQITKTENMKTITRKVDKRAWQSIKAIQACTNMIDVNLYISRAILDTFKLRNLGLSKVIAKKEGKLQEWQQSKDNNSSLMIEHQYEVRTYLLTFVPKHLRMYISK